jgi:hypothetical protein
MGTVKNNSAKFAFFYILSLIALVFIAIATGMVIFQIINRQILDIINEYSGSYSDEQMRFAISALVIATPVFYITARQIYKNLFSGELDEDAGVRKWLTYLIILVAIVVMIGWLIAILNGFLGGELTTKFVLKAMTAVVIAGIIFSFYFYDLKRDKIANRKDKVIRLYFFASLAIIMAVLIMAVFNVDSPQVSRNKKIDNQIINNFSQIDSALYTYYRDQGKMAASLDDLQTEYNYLLPENFQNPVDKSRFVYKVTGEFGYELCTTFLYSNKDSNATGYAYYGLTSWLHEAGYQCLGQKLNKSQLDAMLIEKKAVY